MKNKGIRAVLAFAAAAALGSAAGAQTPDPAAPIPQAYGAPISLDDAQAIIRAGIAMGEAEGLRLSIAVVEPSGELVAFARMDGTTYGSIYVAPEKARTAARYRVTTAGREQQLLAGRTPILSNNEVMAIGGGVPIIRAGRVVGAVGISGATAEQDARIAAAIAVQP